MSRLRALKVKGQRSTSLLRCRFAVILFLLVCCVMCYGWTRRSTHASVVVVLGRRNTRESNLHMTSASTSAIVCTREDEQSVLEALMERLLQPTSLFLLSLPGEAPVRAFLDLRKLQRRHAELLLEHNAPLSLKQMLARALEGVLQRAPSGNKNRALRSILDDVAQQQIPASAALTAIRGIDLGANDLTTLTDDIAALSSSLETLFLTDNLLEHAPRVLASMRMLSRLSLKANRLTSLHPQRDLPKALMHFIATENAITSFESGFYDPNIAADQQFHNLRKLMLAGNTLTNVAAVFGGALSREHASTTTVYDSLELLRISRNRIASLEDTSSGSILANFRSLSWVSFAGNPLTANAAEQAGMAADQRLHAMLATTEDLSSRLECSSNHQDVTILGQGASGVVKQCLLYATPPSKQTTLTPIAVKFFKRISSDGSGADEINALAHVPRHTNIVAPIGYVRFSSMAEVVRLNILDAAIANQMHRFTEGDDDDGPVVAMCFPLVHSKKPLGKPPTIWTVSDDIYENGGLLAEVAPFAVPQETTNASTAAIAVLVHATNALLAALKSTGEVYSVLGAFHDSNVRLVHGDLYAHNMFFGAHQHAPSGSTHQAAFDSVFAQMESLRRDLVGVEVPLNTFWATNGILVTDFGASFHYSAASFDDHASRGLIASETNAIRVFVRDLYESIIPVPHLTALVEGVLERFETPKRVQNDDEQAVVLHAAYPARAAALEQSLATLERCVLQLLQVAPNVAVLERTGRRLLTITAATRKVFVAIFDGPTSHQSVEGAANTILRATISEIDDLIRICLDDFINV